MLKILYAAGNNLNGKLSLIRFIKATKDLPFKIKMAAYKKSSDASLNIDWTLDCLYSIFDSKIRFSDNQYFDIYFNQVKNFHPDLIISDLEPFTSYIGKTLNVPTWQCSSSMLYWAVHRNSKIQLSTIDEYNKIFFQEAHNREVIKHIIDTSDFNGVYSHFGEMFDSPLLKENFEWIRPYHVIGKNKLICKHNIVAATNNSNDLLDITKYEDSILFSENNIDNFKIKNIENIEEYACNLYNCNIFLCQGQSNFLADAFYNKKNTIIYPKFGDAECITNLAFAKKYGYCKITYDLKKIDMNFDNFNFSYNSNIFFLHEKILKEFDI